MQAICIEHKTLHTCTHAPFQRPFSRWPCIR